MNGYGISCVFPESNFYFLILYFVIKNIPSVASWDHVTIFDLFIYTKGKPLSTCRDLKKNTPSTLFYHFYRFFPIIHFRKSCMYLLYNYIVLIVIQLMIGVIGVRKLHNMMSKTLKCSQLFFFLSWPPKGYILLRFVIYLNIYLFHFRLMSSIPFMEFCILIKEINSAIVLAINNIGT